MYKNDFMHCIQLSFTLLEKEGPIMESDGRYRKNIQIGHYVEIVQKNHQRSGELTEGVVKRILTSSPQHPHGIKVMLDSGEVGRVKNVLPE
jgi:uncharacterized repeat protein (TIGR03833 family)